MTTSWADSYLGQLRALAGDRTLMFVGARAVFLDSTGDVLLIQRSDNGHWAMPAGAMELGESITDCVAREVWEETGLRALTATPFALHTGPAYTITNVYGDRYQLFTVLFRIDVWEGDLATVTEETTDAGFFALDALPAPLSPAVGETLDDLASFDHSGQLVVK